MRANFAKHCVNFWIGACELVREKVTLGVADELNEGHYHSPWMRTMTEHSFKKYLRHYFLERLLFDRGKEMKQQSAKPESMVTRESKIEHDGAD